LSANSAVATTFRYRTVYLAFEARPRRRREWRVIALPAIALAVLAGAARHRPSRLARRSLPEHLRSFVHGEAKELAKVSGLGTAECEDLILERLVEP
jgi:hypothetical protein